MELRDSLARLAHSLFPGQTLVEIKPLGVDESSGTHEKATGYGRVLRLTLRGDDGVERRATFHTAAANEYGHDRASDRAAEMLLAAEDFERLPRHVRVLDVGAVQADGTLQSLRTAQDFYLIASWAEGHLYVDDLRRLARGEPLLPRDLGRCDALVDYLVELHRERYTEPLKYRRAIRDLIGSGEGIFGIVDAYPPDTPGAPPSRLQAIEAASIRWRWALHDRVERLRRTHGDFHPFNVLFAGDVDLTALDASRGCAGDPADDVTAMAVNYVFFALGNPATWRPAFGPLWRRFWQRYLERTSDAGLLEVVAPFLAWRALVVASPRFYPDLPEASRNSLLGLAEKALREPRFDPAWADELFS